MRSDYTSMPSMFYGSDRGHNYDCPGARRDLAHVPQPLRVFPFPCQRVVLSAKLEDPTQLRVKARELVVIP